MHAVRAVLASSQLCRPRLLPSVRTGPKPESTARRPLPYGIGTADDSRRDPDPGEISS
jgi:hypothetical protein